MTQLTHTFFGQHRTARLGRLVALLFLIEIESFSEFSLFTKRRSIAAADTNKSSNQHIIQIIILLNGVIEQKEQQQLTHPYSDPARRTGAFEQGSRIAHDFAGAFAPPIPCWIWGLVFCLLLLRNSIWNRIFDNCNAQKRTPRFL